MTWLTFQTAIICAVIAANFFWLHLPGYAVGVAGVLAAWLATRIVSLFLRNTYQ